MNKDMRKEIKIGLVLYAIFNVINLVTKEIGDEIPALHFLLGGVIALVIAEFVIGLLPETAYLKLKKYKKNL